MKIGRRDLLVLGGATALGVGCNNHANVKIPAMATYDEVIEALFPTDFEFGGGTNHGPMVADALVEAGRPQRHGASPFVRPLWVDPATQVEAVGAALQRKIALRADHFRLAQRRRSMDWFASDLGNG